ncbi:MAG: hypothetical protein AAF840_17015, partial [Bacteroidota bacterium]
TTPASYDLEVTPNDEVRPGPFYAEPVRNKFTCGMAVSTMGAEASGNKVVTVKDIRDRTGVPVSSGGAWGAPDLHDPKWNDSELGEVFGIATDEEFNVYLTAAMIPTYALSFSISNNQAIVFNIEPTVGAINEMCYASNTPTATGTNRIFNNNEGIGNIVSNDNGLLFLTNISDATIVVIEDMGSASPGNVVQVYNVTSFGVNDFFPTEQVWGIGYNPAEERIYFSSPQGTGANIYSIDATGGVLSGPEVLEFSVGGPAIADIAFTDSGTQMLLAERGGAHNSRAYQYFGGASTTWTGQQEVFVGAYGSGRNSAGGVDYAYSSFTGPEPTDSECETFIAASGDALNYQFMNYIYGYALFPITGNAAPNGWPFDAADYANVNSIFLDNDVNTDIPDKVYQGDVEVFDCACPSKDCAEENGLQMLPASPVDPNGVGDCCFILDFR